MVAYIHSDFAHSQKTSNVFLSNYLFDLLQKKPETNSNLPKQLVGGKWFFEKFKTRNLLQFCLYLLKFPWSEAFSAHQSTSASALKTCKSLQHLGRWVMLVTVTKQPSLFSVKMKNNKNSTCLEIPETCKGVHIIVGEEYIFSKKGVQHCRWESMLVTTSVVCKD